MHFENCLGGKSKLRDNVLCVFKIAVERIILGGNVHAIVTFYTEPIVFYVQAVNLQRSSVYQIIRAVIMTFYNEAFGRVVSKRTTAKLLKAIAPRHRIYLDLILKVIFTALNLRLHLTSLPLKPVGNVYKFRIPLICRERSVLVKSPSLPALLAKISALFDAIFDSVRQWGHW